jgi:oligopeptide/dipeptide ABC transporter ATP-binding protein
MNEVRIGVIGLGKIGEEHIKTIENIKNARLTAVCDYQKDVVNEYAKEFSVKAFYDAKELINSGEVDAVIIATPHYQHTQITIDALNADLHVLCEKPVAVHKADAEKMIEAHRKNPKLKFAVMLQVRTIMKKPRHPYTIGLLKSLPSLSIGKGETLGFVGESGSGKTTTGRAILRAINPTAGEVILDYNDELIDLTKLSHKELKSMRPYMQMIFQDPFSSLNPRMTVQDIVAEPLIIHKMAKGSELEDRVVQIIKKVGLKPEHRTRYPHAFSGGQRQRIGIARALIMKPALIVCDEAVSALDVSVQAQVINLLTDLQHEFGLTYIFIAHDLSVVKHICDRVAVMYAGKIVELASTGTIFDNPSHPHTKALLSAIPSPDPDKPMNINISGEVADPGNLPSGSSFAPRCEFSIPQCEQKIPELEHKPDGRFVACDVIKS